VIEHVFKGARIVRPINEKSRVLHETKYASSLSFNKILLDKTLISQQD
jgi:hypothetical protein